MKKAREFLIAHGMDAERIDLVRYSRLCYESMDCGLRYRQKNVPMIPTYLRADSVLREGKKVAVIDAGGTNFRTALLSFSDGREHIEALSKHPMPGSTEPISWEEFISFTADCVAPLLDETDEIGFCFSYPADATEERDCRVISLTKQVTVTGAEGQLLGSSLNDELSRRGIGRKKLVVLNDTPAAYLVGPSVSHGEAVDGYIGMIAGTGINTCAAVDISRIEKLGIGGSGKMLINLETGSADCFPRGDFDRQLDETLPDRGTYLAEKMCSGAYLGRLCLHTLKGAAEEGLLSEGASAYITALSRLETPEADAWLCGAMPEEFSAADRVFSVDIIYELFDRAARCMACTLTGILLLTGEKRVCIAADGSLYTRSSLFAPALKKHMSEYAEKELGCTLSYITCSEATLIGTAAAILMN